MDFQAHHRAAEQHLERSAMTIEPGERQWQMMAAHTHALLALAIANLPEVDELAELGLSADDRFDITPLGSVDPVKFAEPAAVVVDVPAEAVRVRCVVCYHGAAAHTGGLAGCVGGSAGRRCECTHSYTDVMAMVGR